MLDKSIPYCNLIMVKKPVSIKRRKGLSLPANYTLRPFTYNKNDEKAWAKIETAALEFDDEEKALAYFKKEYLSEPEEVVKRCFLLFDEENNPVATASAWFEKIDDKKHPMVHWVAVIPSCQGKGLGRAVMENVLAYFAEHHPEENIYLHTQTWSHKAVIMYHKLGFSLVKDQGFFEEENIPSRYRKKENEYTKALTILKKVLPKELYEKLVKEAL